MTKIDDPVRGSCFHLLVILTGFYYICYVGNYQDAAIRQGVARAGAEVISGGWVGPFSGIDRQQTVCRWGGKTKDKQTIRKMVSKTKWRTRRVQTLTSDESPRRRMGRCRQRPEEFRANCFRSRQTLVQRATQRRARLTRSRHGRQRRFLCKRQRLNQIQINITITIDNNSNILSII